MVCKAMPNVVDLQHTSEKLKGNAWNDPVTRKLPVYLPPGYDDKRAKPYPVLYFLNGYSGKGEGLLVSTNVFYQPMPERLDAMIARGESPPFIAVFPDASTKLGASQYVNSATNGPYMDWLCDEIVPFVDAQFNTRADPAARAVLGHSSGGFGALVTAMLRPDAFLHLLSSAGDGFYENIYLGAIGETVAAIQSAGGVGKFIDKFLACPNPSAMLSKSDFLAMMILCMCTCYSPNPSVPDLKADLYFDPEDGRVRPDVWEKFLAWDPVRMVGRYEGALGKMKSIRLDAGLQDEYGLQWAHRQFAAELRARGIPYELNEFEGKHTGQPHRFAERFAWMAARIEKLI